MENGTKSSPDSRFATKPSLTVVERIADLEETNPAELTPPLYAAIDPDALDTLVQSSATKPRQTVNRISFTYCGYDVDVRSDGEIDIAKACSEPNCN
ncbi:HalOD1 output domain-containing protein [Natrinema halophilum]|uniref:Halobacterial output domain-containing protein n=1 Tax=Natrinema halophilum TaxID=1699371 RepID=A0A7D5KBQ7_9EURY|nr:HalOD1 output domain-containing protein [Natrinema halophilum]QLG48016.1 hypothetical protein HYG82_03735 [Natrinema halophilum]